MKIGYFDEEGNVVREFYGQGEIYLDTEAYETKEGVCYVSELSDTCYTYKDFLEISEGNEELADMIFDIVDWQRPETLFDELESMSEIIRCEKCNKIYLTHGDTDMKCPICHPQEVIENESE